MKSAIKIAILIVVLAIYAIAVSGCASIPIPSSIPIPNNFPILGGLL